MLSVQLLHAHLDVFVLPARETDPNFEVARRQSCSGVAENPTQAIYRLFGASKNVGRAGKCILSKMEVSLDQIMTESVSSKVDLYDPLKRPSQLSFDGPFFEGKNG
jgi:hypothetical protein